MHWIYKRLYDLMFGAGLVLTGPALMYLKNRPLNYMLSRLMPCKGKDIESKVWIHSVSLGETNAAIPLIKDLANIGISTLATASTPTGFENLQRRLQSPICLAPWDMFFCVENLINKIKPRLLVIMETELWPALIVGTRDKETKIIIANARISDKAFRAYKRHKWFTEYLLGYVDMILAQNQEHADRFEELGMPPHRIQITGNLKYDVEIREQTILSNNSSGKITLLLASTHNNEEELILEELKTSSLLNKVFLIIAPRHIERVNQIEELLARYQIKFALYSKTKGMMPHNASALIIDTIGILPHAYKYADITFIGGSLINHGGQNPIEAAYWQTPIFFGPNMDNFKDIAKNLLDAAGAIQIQNPKQLLPYINESRIQELKALGINAKRVVEKNRGAKEKTIKYILSMINQ